VSPFCAFLGSVAGNAALTLGATGGVFIAGGIAPRFTAFLRASEFRTRFEAKGRLRFYQERNPAAVIGHPSPAFVGLARLARDA
jgi:glucokinase